MIILNFKTYPKATGEGAVSLASICQEVALETGVKIAIALQPTDIFRVAQQIKIPIFAQHCDPASPGRHTGAVTALALKKAGASGVFLNHSEHNFFSFADLGFSIDLAKEQELETLVFVKDTKIALKADQFKPTYMALEEPSLISGGQAMVQLPENHELIREFIGLIKATPLIGAGIKTREDVFNSLKLGIKGVVLSSGFVKAENPKQVLQSLCSAF
ncbi:MAG TPA: triose-phosphate isomerase [Candidatus Bathyarchaeia archaeon]|nr:triose-phosphate isomerase [Candidatus Bathyarchaeia archaeon]